jgi:hypothetical protein
LGSSGFGSSGLVIVTVDALTVDFGDFDVDGAVAPSADAFGAAVGDPVAVPSVDVDPAGDPFDDSADDPGDVGSAHAVPVAMNNAAPTPRATANSPIRPTYAAALMTFAYADGNRDRPVFGKVGACA